MIKAYLTTLFGKPSFGLLTIGTTGILHLMSIIGPVVAFLGIVAGTIAGIFSLIVQYRKAKEARITRREEELKLCAVCFQGIRPKNCPIPQKDRPEHCPLEQGEQKSH